MYIRICRTILCASQKLCQGTAPVAHGGKGLVQRVVSCREVAGGHGERLAMGLLVVLPRGRGALHLGEMGTHADRELDKTACCRSATRPTNRMEGSSAREGAGS